MIINTDSWHYRLLDKMDCRIPRSLCPYFWKVIAMMVISTFIAILLTMITFFFTYGLGFIYMHPDSGDAYIVQAFMSMTWIDHLKAIGYSLTGTSCGVAIIFTFVYLISSGFRQDIHEKIYHQIPSKHRDFEYYSQYRYAKRKNKVPRKPSLIWAYIKARKQKICPILEFK